VDSRTCARGEEGPGSELKVAIEVVGALGCSWMQVVNTGRFQQQQATSCRVSVTMQLLCAFSIHSLFMEHY
jgi:hypothetical protein